jgi:hypothetical protein
MRTSIRTLALVLGALALAAPARSSGLRVLSADDRGLTLEVVTGEWSLSAPDPLTGRSHILGVPETHNLSTPGRALLPFYGSMLAIPPDARPSVRVLSSTAGPTLEGVKLVIAGRPSFQPDPMGGEETPTVQPMTPIVDGAWPAQDVRLGATNPFRGRVLVALEARPFRYDEGASRLTSVTRMTVRIDWNRPSGASALTSIPGEPDPGMDAALGASVLNFEQARPWRLSGGGPGSSSLFAKPSAGMAFDESQPEVRVKIDSTGLYQLPYDLLATKGYPAGVPTAEVGVHRHEFLAGQVPPFATVDVPIEVDDDNGNGTFDSGDRIWVYARTWAARSGASQYQRWWGDADAVFVTRVPAGGARFPKRDGWRNSGSPATPASFPIKTHYEQNGAIIMPFVWVPQDTTVDVFHWTPYAFYYNRPDTILFDTNDADTARSVGITVNWVGRKFGNHFEWAAVRNGAGVVTTVADSVRFAEKRPFTASATLFGSSLTPGRTNALRVWGRPTAGTPTAGEFDAAGLDWFEVTYWRAYKAIDGVLDCNSSNTGGEVQVHATNFLADSVRLFDVTDPENPVRLILDESHVQRGATVTFDFQDSVVAGVPHRYVAGTVDPNDPDYGLRIPPAANVSAVTRRSLYAASPADYVIVAPEAFLPALQPLVDLRTAQGLRVLVAPTESIYDEFTGGRHSAVAIQRFARYAYQNWSTRFLVLFGDGTIDPQGFSTRSGFDWVPVIPIPGPVAVTEGYEIVPSDAVYGCITGNCDPYYGSIIPELMIGRLPVNSLAQAQAVVAKLVAYENLSGDQSWRRHVLLSCDDAFSGDTFFGGGGSQTGYCHRPDEEHFAGLSRKCASIITRDAGLAQMNVELFDLAVYLSGETVINDCRPDRAATQARCHANVTPVLFSKLNSGVLWWNYQGHANEYVLTHEDLYINAGEIPSNDDKFLFQNAGKPTLYTAFSCHTNMFGRNDAGPNSTLGGCLGEDMVTLPLGGAIGSWASDCYEVVPTDPTDSSHVNVELARSLFASVPQDEFVPGDRGSRVVLGEAVQATFVRYAPVSSARYGEAGIGLTYTLLGDPGTRLSIGRPQTLVYANDSLVDEAVPVRLHTQADTLRLVADLVSTVRLDSLGVYENSGAGDVAVPASAYTVSPAFPDTAGGGTFGGRRFRVVYRTQPPPRDVRYIFRVRDRNALQSDFTATLLLSATLRVDGTPIQDGDAVSPRANLSLYVVCPRPLVPASDLVLTVNGQAQAFTPAPAPGDASGREWVLSWTHGDYPKDDYRVDLTVAGGVTLTHRFKVSLATGELRVQDLFAFPNPFDNDGTAFSFILLGSDPADVKIDIYTLSGRRVQSLVWNGLPPGYHQLPWDGNDAEAASLANGVYLYRLSAKAPGTHVEQLGRLVKLRKPRHVDAAAAP